MPYVTKEQIAAAKQMCAMEFLRKYRPGELVPGGAKNEYQLKAHDSFKIKMCIRDRSSGLFDREEPYQGVPKNR